MTGTRGVCAEGRGSATRVGTAALGKSISHFPVFWGAEGWLCWGKALLGSAEGWWITCTRGTNGFSSLLWKPWLKWSGLPLPQQWGCWKCFPLPSIFSSGPHSTICWRNGHQCSLCEEGNFSCWTGTFELQQGTFWCLTGRGQRAGCVQGHQMTFSGLNLPPVFLQRQQISVKYKTEEQPRSFKACGNLQDPTSSPRIWWCSAQMTKERYNTSELKLFKGSHVPADCFYFWAVKCF